LTIFLIGGRYQVVGTTCNKSVERNNLVASCQQAVRTHPVDKSAAGLLQLVRFYVRKMMSKPEIKFDIFQPNHNARPNAELVY
jgi:hypothetical protein